MENKFTDICTFEVLYKAYLAARRGKRSRAATAHYEVHLLENIVNLVYILTTKTYRPGVFRVFYVYEPKKRLVQAPAFVDKVVQHAVVDNIPMSVLPTALSWTTTPHRKTRDCTLAWIGSKDF